MWPPARAQLPAAPESAAPTTEPQPLEPSRTPATRSPVAGLAAEAGAERVPAAANADSGPATAGPDPAPGGGATPGPVPGAAVDSAPPPLPVAAPDAPVAAHPAQRTQPAWHEARLAPAIDTPAFAAALGTHLTLFVREGVQQARLHLNPAEMGPIAVQISLQGNAAHVELVAEHAATRQVLEQAMPVLAGALRDHGLTLAGGGVFDQPRRPPEEAAPQRGPARQDRGPQADDTTAAMAGPARRLLGALDVYA